MSAVIKLTDDQYHILQSTDGAVTARVGSRTVVLHGPHGSAGSAVGDRLVSLDDREIALIGADSRGLTLDGGETIRWEAGS